MASSDIFNVVFLCIINVFFMVVGIFVNSVVIISIWKSRQLRKKLCYFTILVLSCFDLAVVSITHPFFITSTIYYFLEDVDEIRRNTRISITFMLYGFSISALFALNVERFLALTCPYFHQKSVTKTKLVCFQAFMTIMIVAQLPLLYVNRKTVFAVNIFVAVSFSLLLLLLVCGNYKMFMIAKSKREEKMISPTAGTSMDGNRNSRILNFKNISTCSLAVGCFFICSCPQIMVAFFRLATVNIWSNTFTSINSTLNCLIFFWRNSILRREGMKILANAFRAHVIN